MQQADGVPHLPLYERRSTNLPRVLLHACLGREQLAMILV